MAAPTPVSALVHSSTLVTAGVYLIFRFYNLLSHEVLNLLAIVGCLTIFFSGLSAIAETDLKKVVALSTLSQLGLIVSSFGVGASIIAFFHLLTHAFMKALLFMSVGNIIHFVNSYQDSRVSSLNIITIPFTGILYIIPNISLSGIPFIAGFYSKDL